MYLEIFVHASKLTSLFNGQPTNCKINYADQYDVRLFINPKKYVIIKSTDGSSNMITIRKKKLKDILRFKNKSK